MEVDGVAEKIEFLKQFGTGFRSQNDPLFEANNSVAIKPFTRLGVYRFDDENLCHKQSSIQCNIPNCKQNFDTVFAYESHYNSLHRFLCAQCSKSLPSAHLLDLHLSEKHDSFFAVLSERKPMYRCYLEECERMCQTPAERRDHCITDHKFPHDFRFDCYKNSKKFYDKTKKNSQKPKDKKPQSSSTIIQPSKLLSVASNDEDVELEDKSILLTARNSKRQNFRFCNQKAKTFSSNSTIDYAKSLASKSDQTESTERPQPLETNQIVDDLMDSLPQ